MSVDKSVHALSSTFAAFATTGLECSILLTVLNFSDHYFGTELRQIL